MEAFLGLDLGTSGVRAAAVDAAGGALARAAAPLAPPRREGPRSEQDPETWWRGVVRTLAALLPALPSGARPVRLAVAATSGTVLACDAALQPLGPALLYDDARATGEAARIAEVAPADSPARGPASGLARWLRLRAAGAPHVLHQADWVAARLLGRIPPTDENNALKTGYDPATRRWPGWLAALGLEPAAMPEVVPAGTPLGRIEAGAARELGLPADLVVVAGTTDSTAAVIAAGARAPGDAVTSLGSTLVVKVLSPHPVTDAACGVYSHRLGPCWLAGGASNSGGAVLGRWFTPEELASLSRRIDPETDSGLDYYPLARPGERFPVADPALPPRLGPRPADPARFLHGLLEGIARIEAAGYRRLAELGAPSPRRVLTTGGGAVNAVWTRIRERRLGVPVIPVPEATAALGAALLARGWP